MERHFKVLVLILALASPSACKSEGQSSVQEAFQPSEVGNFFGTQTDVVKVYKDLPTSAALDPQPWHGHYWPSMRWGLLWRYFGETKSPLEKFEAAFQNTLKQNNSNYVSGDLAKYEHQRVQGVSTNWYGICDGMSEAALMFPEPKDSVTINGISFYPYDIKALLGYFDAMSGPSRRIIYAGKVDTAATVSFDDHDRPLDPAYRNINPGLLHLVLANFMGLRNRGLVADVMPNDMVLNFAISAFKVTSSQEITDPAKKAQMNPSDAAAVSIYELTTDVTYADSHRVLETFPDRDQSFVITYHYSLELDQQGRIIGGEWLGDSISNHPNLLWISAARKVDVSQLSTLRLAKKLKVGAAMTQLLAANADEQAEAREPSLRAHPDNLVPYSLFKGWKVPPTPPSMQGSLP